MNGLWKGPEKINERYFIIERIRGQRFCPANRPARKYKPLVTGSHDYTPGLHIYIIIPFTGGTLASSRRVAWRECPGIHAQCFINRSIRSISGIKFAQILEHSLSTGTVSECAIAMPRHIQSIFTSRIHGSRNIRSYRRVRQWWRWLSWRGRGYKARSVLRVTSAEWLQCKYLCTPATDWSNL